MLSKSATVVQSELDPLIFPNSFMVEDLLIFLTVYILLNILLITPQRLVRSLDGINHL
jgi:hypothetical protein